MEAVWSLVTTFGEVLRGEKMLFTGTDPESYITEYTLVHEDSIRIDGVWTPRLPSVASGWTV